MVTKEWMSIHHKHHAKYEASEDSHNPQIHGISKVFFAGIKLYCLEAKRTATPDKYGHGTPGDWIERNVYSKYPALGISIMLAIGLVLFGPIGFIVWGLQMLWIQLFAADVINGVEHYYGYRNFAPNDTFTSFMSWGI